MPEIGRWGGIDELTEKYYPLSPYNYAANSPILVTDPDGQDISFDVEYKRDKDGNIKRDKHGVAKMKSITMKVTGKVINTSDKDADVDQAASDISGALESAFSGSIGGVSFKTETDIKGVSSMDEVSESDHVFALADMKAGSGLDEAPNGGANEQGGKVAFIDVDYFRGPIDTSYGNQGERVAAHEFGHLAGLGHKNSSKSNLMKQGGRLVFGYNFSTMITSSQLGSILRAYRNGQLNKGKNSENFSTSRSGRVKKKMPKRGMMSGVVDY